MKKHINTTSEAFFRFLDIAGALNIDDGALLTYGHDMTEITGHPENEVVRFSWTDVEGDFSTVLTEGGIAAGVFDSDGKFVCEDKEGEKTVFRFFSLERLAGTPEMSTQIIDSSLVTNPNGAVSSTRLKQNAADAIQCLIEDFNMYIDGLCTPEIGSHNDSLENALLIEEMFSDVRALGAAIEEGDPQLISNIWLNLKAQVEVRPSRLSAANMAASEAMAFSIGSSKQVCEHVDPDKNQRYEGSIMGITSHHMVMNLGRSALILNLDKLNCIPKPHEMVVVKFSGGKGSVEPVKIQGVER
jgi:hypothetical protein